MTVISGLAKLWETDVFLALAVTFFALVAPMLKCLGMGLIQFGLLSGTTQPALALMGKLAMADIFILALYIVIAKGIGVGQIDVAWGLYLFTAAVIASMAVSLIERRAARAVRPGRTGRRIAAQRHDVADAGVVVGTRDVQHLAAGRADAGEMRRAAQAGAPRDALDAVRIAEYAGATSGGRTAWASLAKLDLLVTDKPFRNFVVTRALLICSALSGTLIS